MNQHLEPTLNIFIMHLTIRHIQPWWFGVLLNGTAFYAYVGPWCLWIERR